MLFDQKLKNDRYFLIASSKVKTAQIVLAIGFFMAPSVETVHMSSAILEIFLGSNCEPVSPHNLVEKQLTSQHCSYDHVFELLKTEMSWVRQN